VKTCIHGLSAREQCGDCAEMVGDELEDLAADNKRMRRALQEIVDPVRFMREQAEREGKVLDGQWAVRLQDDASYLRGIARKALEG
jgi:hypothetical protein